MTANSTTFLSRRRTLSLTAAGLSLIAVCYGLARFAYGMFLPSFRAEFGLDAQLAGAIASGSYVAYCAAIVVSTILTPRLGARRVAASAGVIATLGIVIVALAPNAIVLAAGVLIAGSSTGVASPPLAHAVARAVRAPRSRPHADDHQRRHRRRRRPCRTGCAAHRRSMATGLARVRDHRFGSHCLGLACGAARRIRRAVR